MTAAADLVRVMCDGAATGRVLEALGAAGAEPEAELREGLHGPSVAVFGRDRAYRYLLTRRWAPGPTLPWLMLNPSKAGAWVGDPTVAKCTGFAQALGFGGIAVMNLFALVATDPDVLRTHPDPVGPGTDACLRAFCRPGGTVVAAWGAHPAAADRAREVTAMLTGAGASLLCLGTTVKGQPRHPGRLAYSTELVPWRAS